MRGKAFRIFVLLAVSAVALWGSPIFWPGSGHWYELTSSAANWSDAQTEALGKGGYLVVINDSAEQAFVASTFASTGDYESFIWIGLYDPSFSGSGPFVWVNGDPVGYTNWAPGEPNNYFTNEWAVEMRTAAYGNEWNDLPGYVSHYGVIEYDNYIPEPATLLFVGTGLIGLAFLRRRKSA
ncbi:MAG: lectin-like protein [candidate division WOR-3 bacterium]